MLERSGVDKKRMYTSDSKTSVINHLPAKAMKRMATRLHESARLIFFA